MEEFQFLNAEQLEACKQVEGPVMVFAGAGTGKTRTLVSRIIYMIEQCNINPNNILAITFTKKATNEMRDRIFASLGNDAYRVHMSTIHSMCSRILRRYIYLLGYDLDFEIIDEEEGLKALSEIYKKDNVDKKTVPPRQALRAFSYYKNTKEELNYLYESIYNSYQKYLQLNNMVDFDDLLILTEKLFSEYPDILKEYQDLYQYILVDEFQDTNRIQYNIIKLLGGVKQNIFVVGDDDQSIYAFRGADYSNIELFENDHLDMKKVILNHNYRSTNAILKGANAIIAKNTHRTDKKLYSDKDGSMEDVMVFECYSNDDEVRRVCDEINYLKHNKGYKNSDIAVLYRNNVLSRNFELGFINRGIPYKMYGGFSYLKRREVKDIMSYLRFILDDTKFVHFQRIVNIPTRGIGDKTVDKIRSLINPEKPSVLDAIERLMELTSTTKNRLLLEFRELIIDLQEKLKTMNLNEFFDYFLDKSSYQMYLKEDLDNYEDRIANVKEFKSVFVEIEDSLVNQDLTNIDKLRIIFDQVLLDDSLDVKNKNPDSVVLSTIHSAKGLEFKVVFLVALEQGLFPAINREGSTVEEERRVAYVACTRAKERMYLSYAKKRLIYGRTVHGMPSQFVREYFGDQEQVDTIVERSKVGGNEGDIFVGCRIYHKIFGYGEVIAVEGDVIKVIYDRDGSIRGAYKNHPTITKC